MFRFPAAGVAALCAGAVALLQAQGALAAEPPESERPARLLAQLAEGARRERVTRAWLSLGTGAALTTAGLLDESDGEASFGRVVWIVGLLSGAGGVLSLILPSPLERLEQQAGAGSDGYTPARLQQRWRAQAEEVSGVRGVIAAVHFVLGGAGLAAGGALAAGLGDWSERRRETWAVQLGAAGAIFASAGAATLLLPSDTEQGYELAYPAAARDSARLRIHFAPASDGATLQIRGAF